MNPITQYNQNCAEISELDRKIGILNGNIAWYQTETKKLEVEIQNKEEQHKKIKTEYAELCAEYKELQNQLGQQ